MPKTKGKGKKDEGKTDEGKKDEGTKDEGPKPDVPQDLKFRFQDGVDIGPNKYTSTTRVHDVKEDVLAQWPEETAEEKPERADEVQLLCAGKKLGDDMTVAESTAVLHDLSGDVIPTLHVLKAPPPPPPPPPKSATSPKCSCTQM
jgi:hypothetical protein